VYFLYYILKYVTQKFNFLSENVLTIMELDESLMVNEIEVGFRDDTFCEDPIVSENNYTFAGKIFSCNSTTFKIKVHA
jgi:hypothetical protein